MTLKDAVMRNLRKYFIEQEWDSIKIFAEDCRINPSQMRLYFAGRALPSMPATVRILKVLEISFEQLTEGADV